MDKSSFSEPASTGSDPGEGVPMDLHNRVALTTGSPIIPSPLNTGFSSPVILTPEGSVEDFVTLDGDMSDWTTQPQEANGGQEATDSWGAPTTIGWGAPAEDAWDSVAADDNQGDEPQSRQTHANSFEPQASAVAAENVGRVTESRWNASGTADSSAPAPAGQNSAGTTNVPVSEILESLPAETILTAMQSMQLGNGTGYAPELPEWAATARRYEWKEEYGHVGPVVPELEQILYHDAFINKKGDKFDDMSVAQVKVTIESEEQIDPIFKWEDAGLHPVMVENIQKCGFTTPTGIQGYCIPAILTGHDVIAVAQTGSGKTGAFLIPTLSKLMGKARKLAGPRPRITPHFDALLDGVVAQPLILVVVPTRELAIQIFDESRRFCYRSMLRPCVAYGGPNTRVQIEDLRKGCDILIGTPGRLLDFIGRPNVLSLHRVRYTIIDEADELVSPDWVDEMDRIMACTNGNVDGDHHYMMFSATFPREARALAKRHLADDYIRIRVGRIGAAHNHVTQKVIWVNPDVKIQACFDLIVSLPPARTIIFVNSRRACDYVDDFLFNCGLPCTSIHSERSQLERESAFQAFRRGKAPILVCTGVSARGLDFYNVLHIINYDLPSVDQGGIHEYVHRIGRTARIGNVGSSTAFYNERDEGLAQDLVNCLLESDQEVPDFLQHLVPEGDKKPDFADDQSQSGDEEKYANGASTGAWGTSSNKDDEADTADHGDGWNESSGNADQDTSANDWNSGW